MLDTVTKKRIDDCRDILVGKLPDPKAQIEQITIALIYKFMDDMDKEAIELGGKAKFFSDYKISDPKNSKKTIAVEFKKYAWDNLINPKVSAAEMLKLYSEAIDLISKNPNIPQLFRDIFNNAYLPYRSPETLKMFLKTISEFEYTHSEKLGDAFEYLLSVMGSQGDAGQFRTPRHIIDFLVKIVDPGKNDTILDPACGTAGFLISAYKHIKESSKKGLTPDDRKRLMKNVVGYDISPDMVRLSRVNLYLHGFSEPHIYEYDTLSSEDRWKESYDVILANPPFMSPKGGIMPHKKFSISSNRSEVLFVDYIAEHLNPKGRAGIIVPEGVIFQSGTAYKDLRKMLVANYLYAVVSLPAGVFNPYSGVKTSILLMDKELAKKSKEILFVKIDNDGYNLGAQRNAVKGGQLENTVDTINKFRVSIEENKKFNNTEISHAVKKVEIGKNGDYNLNGERYVIVVSSNSSMFKCKKLNEVVEIKKGSSITSATVTKGEIPVIAGGQQPAYFHNQYNRNGKTITVSASGAYAGFINYFESPIFASDCTTIQSNEEIFLTRFLYHLLKVRQEDFYKLQKGGAQPHVYGKDFGEIIVPVPPLTIQQQIVTEIEAYQKIIDGAKMVVENYIPKIEIDPEWQMVELNEVCAVTSGGTPDRGKPEYWNGKIPYIKTGQIHFEEIYQAEEYITSKGLENSSTKIVPAETILMAMYGQGVTRGRVAILKIDAAINQAVAAISPDQRNILTKYLYYYLLSQYDYLRQISESRGGNQSNLNAKLIKELIVPIPSLTIQNKIVSRLENEMSLVNSNKQLIEIFEQKIKDVINKVWQGKGKKYEEKEVELGNYREVAEKKKGKYAKASV